jgi:hypothetical protein
LTGYDIAETEEYFSAATIASYGWYARVKTTGAGTLRTYAIYAD